MNSSSNPNTMNHDNEDEDIINWEEEAAAIIKDISLHVSLIEVSRQLLSDGNEVYMNLRTIEGQDYCVNVSSSGFRVVANAFDTINVDKDDMDENEIYETPYALLDKISPSYVESFGNQLRKQLLSVQQMRTQFNEEDEEGFGEDNGSTQIPHST